MSVTAEMKIAVDSSDFRNKFEKDVSSLQESLTKTQKEMGLVVDKDHLLYNSLGKVVEGLSASDVRAGKYVDQLGRVLIADDKYVDGLNRVQQALGMYKDSLGNVYDRHGVLIQQSQALTAQQNSVRDSATQAVAGFAQLGNTVMALSGIQGMANGELTETQRILLAVSGSVSSFATAFQAVQGVTVFLRNLKTATEAQTMAQTILNAVSGNWLSIAAGVAVAGVGIYSTMNQTEKSVDSVAEKFSELEEAAKKAGLEIKNSADVIAAGFSVKESDLKNQIDFFKSDKKASEEEIKNTPYKANYLPNGGVYYTEDYEKTDALRERVKKDDEKIKELENEYYKKVKTLADNVDQRSKTQTEKLESEKKELKEYLGELEKSGKYLDVQEKVQKAIQTVDQQILEAKEKEKTQLEKDAESKRKQEEANRKALADQSGVTNYIKKSQELNLLDDKAVQSKKDDWDKLIGDQPGMLTAIDVQNAKVELNKEVNKAKKEYQEKIEKETNDYLKAINQQQKETLSSLGFNELHKSVEDIINKNKTLEEKYVESFDAYQNAFNQGRITAEQLAAAQVDLAAFYYSKKEDEQAEQQKKINEQIKQTRSNLNVDSIIDNLKNPFDKLEETLEKINSAYQYGAINENEKSILEQNAKNELFDKKKNKMLKNQEKAENINNIKENKGIEVGSKEYYEAMVNNKTRDYQDNVIKHTKKSLQFQRESRDLLQDSNDALVSLENNLGVWGA